jgi:hypothetical protein
MHPFERLRYVARADEAGPVALTVAATRALAGLADDQAGLVTGCRQMVDRHPAIGALWWVCAHMLTAEDPERSAWGLADALNEDEVPGVLLVNLPQDAIVIVLGWPEMIAPALHRRGDVEVRAVDLLGDGHQLVRSLSASDVAAIEVPEAGMAAAIVDAADAAVAPRAPRPALVVLEALALGPTGIVAAAGSRAAAAVGRHAGVPVWAVAGVGRALPGPMWDALCRRLADAGDPWELDVEVVPADLVDVVVGDWGVGDVVAAVERSDCPVTPELFKGVFAPGTRR